MSSFKAFRIHSETGKVAARFESLTLNDLAPGDVVIRVATRTSTTRTRSPRPAPARSCAAFRWSAASTSRGSSNPRPMRASGPGEPVLVTGCGLSETHDGGYAQFARVPGDWVIPIPKGLDAFSAMAIGTAGFTAALAIHRMEQNGQAPQGGPIAVTGASGGVGSIAVDMLAVRGYRVVAVSGKADAEAYLRELGASEVLKREELDLGSRPLENARFAGAIDNLGGDTLAWLTRTVDFWGNIASIGLASSAELKTTVMPFILRGVALLGINSSATRREWRLAVWQRIATDLKPRHLERIVTRTIDFEELPGAFPAYLEGRVTGRTVVRIT